MLMIVVIILLQIILPIISVVWESGLTIKSIAADTEKSWDVSEKQDSSIIATFDSSSGTLNIKGTGKIKEESFDKDYPWYGNRNNIIRICITDGIENVPTRAFEEYSNLREVSLGNSIKVIEYEAFKECKSLNKIVLPEGLQTIDRAAFQSCVGLTSITIPNSVKLIGQEDQIINGQEQEYQFNVFRGCTNVQSISI